MALNAIIVGAGAVARELLARLGATWDVTVVDTDEASLGHIRGERPFRPVVGDGSSRVVLDEAGLDEADALVASTGRDDVNLEVCRLARQAHVSQIAAVFSDPGRLREYRDLQVPAFSPARLAARQLELSLEAGRTSSKAFAGGRVEAVEFRVGPNAPVRGMQVAEIDGPSRQVVSILRGSHLMLRAALDEAEIQVADLVTVVGTAQDLPVIVEAFTSGRPRFPLDFGKRVAVVLAEEGDIGRTFVEAANIARSSEATSLLALHPADEDKPSAEIERLLEAAGYAAEGIELQTRGAAGNAKRALSKLTEEASVGVMVVPPPSKTWLGRLSALRTIAHSRRTKTPVLFSTGRPTYESILVAARRTPAGQAAGRAAIDLARRIHTPLTALAVVDPVFIGGSNAHEEARLALVSIKQQAALQAVEIATATREGDPLKAFEAMAESVDLVVLGAARGGGRSQAGLAASLARAGGSSVLVVPSDT